MVLATLNVAFSSCDYLVNLRAHRAAELFDRAFIPSFSCLPRFGRLRRSRSVAVVRGGSLGRPLNSMRRLYPMRLVCDDGRTYKPVRLLPCPQAGWLLLFDRKF